MKKINLILAILLVCCLLLAGCGAAESTPSDTQNNQNTPAVSDTGSPDSSEQLSGTSELAPPVMEWWELYNPNGFDTVTAVITNPNDVGIDVTYDLVYYKDGEEIARSEGFANFAILPGQQDVIWANYDIPKSTDVDDVKMENVFVSEAYYPAINGTYEYVGVTDNLAEFNFTFDSTPTLATIWFVLYNDNNSNEQFDKGEIVVVSSASLMEQTGTVSFETDVFPYTNFDVYFTAY